VRESERDGDKVSVWVCEGESSKKGKIEKEKVQEKAKKKEVE
jgi:hypothetical protein